METVKNAVREEDICAWCGYDMQGAIHCPYCGTGIWTPDMPYWHLSRYGRKEREKEGNE